MRLCFNQVAWILWTQALAEGLHPLHAQDRGVRQETFLTPAQLDELRGLITDWRAKNPQVTLVGFVHFAEFAEAEIRRDPDTWDLVTPARIGVVTFAFRNWKPGEHAAATKTVTDSGFACVSSTMLRDKSVLRLCTINPLTTEDDIVETIHRLAAARPA